MRVVLDTNILVSALLYGGVPLEVLSLAESGVVQPLASREALAELLDVLSRPKFAQRFRQLGFSPRTAASRYRALATMIEPKERPRLCSDEADDEFLAIAVTGHADVIVSGDSHLLSCAESPVPVVTATEFLFIVRDMLTTS